VERSELEAEGGDESMATISPSMAIWFNILTGTYLFGLSD
jgi:hypothetical protein